MAFYIAGNDFIRLRKEFYKIMEQEKTAMSWLVRPQGLPEIVRSCSKCGCKTRFLCSGLFRVNGQKKKLDVWLIYKCHKCDTKWNMEIMSRVHADEMGRELFEGFTSNSYALAFRYAFDVPTLNRNKAEVCYDSVGFAVEGSSIDLSDAAVKNIKLALIPEHSMAVKVTKVLRQKLEVSSAALARIIEAGGILCEDVKDIGKARLKKRIELELKPQIIRQVLSESKQEKAGSEELLSEAM